ncbi:MAG: polyphosphate kinase 2 (PPK2 family) [Verrucomicrobiales bacterium]|jgi:polyphosphate kinase 2 (PPK2 family)
MFRTAELGRTVPKDEYEEQVTVLRAALLDNQRRLRDSPFPVIIVFGGVDGAGKSESIRVARDPCLRATFAGDDGETRILALLA